MLELRVAPASEAADAADVELPASPSAVRAAAGHLGRDLCAGRSAFVVPGLAGPRLTAFVEGLVLGAHRTRPPLRGRTVGPVELRGVEDVAALDRGRENAAAVVWARDLANTPAATKTPVWLARQAGQVLGPLGVDVIERDEKWLETAGFGGVLAVGRGSASPPRLIEASWRPRNARKGIHLVLVGKGITFDTGGVNRKLGDGMRTMHTDMSGGAAVLGALRLVATTKVPVRVTALVPAAENALSGSSFRPGDVVRHYGGRTSEIGNTDAEGRLVLADALAYAVAKLKPTALVDIATLTGAMKIALGMRTGGVLATSDPLADGLLAAGEVTGEPLWRLPMPVEYESTLRSEIADANNAPGNPGGITAALFLKPFVKDVPWAHLDVAGPARSPEDDGMFTQGGTGFGVRLLHAWVDSLA
ncbi:MAG: leucyl aminopeptidase family protein, partial [Jatrophihabitans sp.]